MRRALVALVLTVAVVVWLARYETHPPAPAKRPKPRSAEHVIAGPIFSTPFSAIQVGVVVEHGKVTDVKTLILTGAGAHARALNARAEPLLRKRALATGSAKFDAVSGATYTSESYKASLQGALDKARSIERRAGDVRTAG